MSNIRDLNVILIGHALVRLAVTSRLMGHEDLTSTARDYLIPHAAGRSPEQQFVLDVLTGKNPVDAAEAISALDDIPLPVPD